MGGVGEDHGQEVRSKLLYFVVYFLKIFSNFQAS